MQGPYSPNLRFLQSVNPGLLCNQRYEVPTRSAHVDPDYDFDSIPSVAAERVREIDVSW